MRRAKRYRYSKWVLQQRTVPSFLPFFPAPDLQPVPGEGERVSEQLAKDGKVSEWSDDCASAGDVSTRSKRIEQPISGRRNKDIDQ